MPAITLLVPQNYSLSERLDVYVSKFQENMNRSKLKVCVVEILLNGKKAKLSSKIHAKDKIEILWEDNIPQNIQAQNIPLKIIYEDENVTIVNKAQGMVTHPALGNWSGTLVNALLYHWGANDIEIKNADKENIAFHRPGIVHRLDKDTSGIIVTAKNRLTEEYLGVQFKERLLQKEYICIVQGRPLHCVGDIKTQIFRDPKNRKKFKADSTSKDGKFARTIYHCIASYGNYSIIRVRIKTGRTHQIRVHMRYIGCPILGDALYAKKDENFPDVTLMLHSRQLILKLPSAQKYHRFKATIPPRFYKVLSKLKKMYPKENCKLNKV